MTILSRYIFREFLRMALTILAGILVLFLCVTFLREADDFVRQKATLSQIARYYLYGIPGMVGQALPFSALIGTLLSLGALSRNQEITAMRAGGISLFRILLPVVLGGMLLSAAGFLNNEVIMPEYSARAAYIRMVEVEKKQQLAVYQTRKLWLRGPDNSVANFDIITPDRTAMIGVNIFKLNPDFSLRERITAEKLVWENDAWRLKGGQRFIPRGDAIIALPADNEVYNVVERPADMGLIAKKAEEMSFNELWNYVSRLKSIGFKVVRYEVDLYGKLAYPLASLLMVMIATPFSLQRVRSGGAARGIAMAVLIAAIYWALTSFGRALGLSGALQPVQAAWFANAAFALLAGIALIRMQRTM